MIFFCLLLESTTCFSIALILSLDQKQCDSAQCTFSFINNNECTLCNLIIHTDELFMTCAGE